MPERQSMPSGATAEQDAEAEPRGPAADAPAHPDEEPTRPVTRRSTRPEPPSSTPPARPSSTPATPSSASPSAPSRSTPTAPPHATLFSPPSSTPATPLSSTYTAPPSSAPPAPPPEDAATVGLPRDVTPNPARDRRRTQTPVGRAAVSALDAIGGGPAPQTPVRDQPATAPTRNGDRPGEQGPGDGQFAVPTPVGDPAGAPPPSGDCPTVRTVDDHPTVRTDHPTVRAVGHPTARTVDDRPTAPPVDDRPTRTVDDHPTTGTPGGDPTGVVAHSAADPCGPAGDAPPEADDAVVTQPTDSPIFVVRSPSPAADRTQTLPVPDGPTVQLTAERARDDPASEDAPTVAQPAPSKDEPPATRSSPRLHLLIGGGVVALLAVLYGGDLALSSGSVPRGVTVEGVPLGGLAFADAEQTLRAQLGPRTTRPIPITVGDARSTVDPAVAGLAVDWPATLAKAEQQPLDPVTRIASFFTTHETGVVTRSNPAAMEAALNGLKPAFDKPPVEGNVRFEGTTPQPIEPVAGQQLAVPAAAVALTRDWASGRPVALPLSRVEPTTQPDDVTAALEKIAKPAVSAPITITGEKGASATLVPVNIATALTFHPDPSAGLVPELNQDAISKALQPQLADSETPGRDATLDFTGAVPVVVPSQDGRGVDYPATVKAILPMLAATAPRQVAAVYGEQPAKLTTEGLSKLGISGIIGEFTTRGFAADSGMNIKRAAAQINGTIVQPGATFSLNAATNPRDTAHGYVEAGIIEDGHPARGVGGGVSQVATTLYNAAYFAGMTNVEHKEHSFYISRYPVGREATVFDNLIDLKFRNDNPTAVMIQTSWRPGSITVRIYGTKRYDVTSTTGPRTNPTDPKTVTISEGEQCTPSKGAPGFTVTDTRTLKDVTTGQVRTETRTVHYNPSPTIKCGDDQ